MEWHGPGAGVCEAHWGLPLSSWPGPGSQVDPTAHPGSKARATPGTRHLQARSLIAVQGEDKQGHLQVPIKLSSWNADITFKIFFFLNECSILTLVLK